MNVVVVKFSDGDHNIYFINGQRDESIQHDQDLFHRLVGQTLQSYRTAWVSPLDWNNPEPWELFEYLNTLQEVEQHFETYPETKG